MFTVEDPGSVQVVGSVATVGGATFQMDPPRTLYGTAANRPDAAAAHAVVPFAYYVVVDSPGTVYQTDGGAWLAQ